ncbi:MAG: hypothetical protein AAFR05_11660, partial [Bacteroidota bacterium]
VDGRRYDEAIQILTEIGVTAIRLITNNPLKMRAIDESAIQFVERVPLVIAPRRENRFYLQTKEDLMGHLLNANGKD